MADDGNGSGWRLAYGVSLYATESGLVVDGERRWRISLNDRALESDIVGSFARSRDLRDPNPERAALALSPLRKVGALARPARIAFFDRLGLDVRLSTASTSAQVAADIGTSDLVVICARREDAAVGEALDRCEALGAVALVVVTSRHEVLAVLDDPRAAPCARCALSFDARAAFIAEAEPLADSESAHSSHEEVGRLFASAVVARYASMLEPLAAGLASVWDVRAGTAGFHEVPRAPSCRCSTRPEGPRGTGTDVRWDTLARARFAPLVPLGATDSAARVAYRVAREPWPLRRDSFGIAMAVGPACRERAVAEGIERFAMLHGPPTIHGRARRGLEHDVLTLGEIRSLLFQEEDYGAPGFRFVPYDDDLALDWSLGARASTGTHVLVPTSLVARVPKGSVRLVDATSNGYAAHPSADEAKLRALLEVIERDVLLTCWHTSVELERIEEDEGHDERILLRAPSDVDLPIVVAAQLTRGGLRIGSAAGLSFDDAAAAALNELTGQLADTTVRPAEDLSRADRGYGPIDHLAYYSNAPGRELFDRWRRARIVNRVHDLRSRWPSRPRSVDGALGPLRALGLDAIFVDRSLPKLFGEGWSVVRALVPGLVEMSWGLRYRRIASHRIADRLLAGAALSTAPHPYA